MVWGCITLQRFGKLVRCEGKVDSAQYQKILKEGLLPTLEEHGFAKETNVERAFPHYINLELVHRPSPCPVAPGIEVRWISTLCNDKLIACEWCEDRIELD